MADHANTFLLLSILMMMTILLVFGMKYFSEARRNRDAVLKEGVYLDLAEKMAGLQAASTASLTSLQADVATIREQISAIETVLKEVE